MPLSLTGRLGYHQGMITAALRSSVLLPFVALSALALAVAALAFTGWLHFGDAIILSLSETGLAYCF